jgi:c-di-GMP-binding flagellar brake protein YcgR
MHEGKKAKPSGGSKKKSAEQLKGEERRRADRLSEENEITITIVSGGEETTQEKVLYNFTKDISAGGVRIQANILLPVNALIKINLALKSLRQNIIAFGKVKWNKIIIKNETYEAGVEFIDTPGESIKILEDYISCKQKYTQLNPVGMPFWMFAKFNK